MLVHRRVTPPTPSINFAGTHLYTWVERGTVRVKCLAQEHNTMSLSRTQTRTAPSRVDRTNHEANQTERDCKISLGKLEEFLQGLGILQDKVLWVRHL